MFTFLRENATKWMVKAVLWTLVAAFVGTIFLVWGYGNEGGERPVAKVGSYSITQAEYGRYYENMVRRMQEMTGGQLTPAMIKEMKIERSALEGLIMEKLQLKAAKDAGTKVSDEELLRDVENTAAFQSNGKFDRETYFAVLRANNLAPREYEKLLRQDIMVRKISQIVTDAVQVTDMEVRDIYERDNAMVRISYFELTPAAFEAEARRASAKGLEGYFKANSARFLTPERRIAGLVWGDPMELTLTYQPSDTEMRGFHASHRAAFGAAGYEQSVGRIRAMMLAERGEAEAKGRIAAVIKGSSGKDLKTLAKENGLHYQEVSLAAGDVVRGMVEGQKLSAELFAAKENEAVGPVRAGGALYAFMVTKVVPPAPPALNEVRARVEAAYVKDESARLAAEAAAKAAERLNAGQKIAAVAGSAKVRDSKPFKRSDKLEGVLAGSQVPYTAAGLKQGGAAQIKSGETFVVLQVVERKGPDAAQFEGEKYRLREAILSRKRQDVLLAWQAELRSKAEKSGLVTIDESMM